MAQARKVVVVVEENSFLQEEKNPEANNRMSKSAIGVFMMDEYKLLKEFFES
jgi:hypothetical protein